MFKKEQNFIVTGATGFIGRELTKVLIKNKYKVTILVRNISKAKKIFNNKLINIILYDINNTSKKFNFSHNGTLIHCAWSDVRNINSKNHLKKNYPNSLKFIKSFINKGIKNIVVLGSCYEYGLQYGPTPPTKKTKPNSNYALSKDKLHKSLRIFKKKKFFNLIWCRLFYIYGENQKNNNVVSKFINSIKKNKKRFNMSYGEQLLDYLPINIAVKKIYNILKYKNGIFNISSGSPISLRRLLENIMIKKKKKIKLNLGYYNYRKKDSLAIWGD